MFTNWKNVRAFEQKNKNTKKYDFFYIKIEQNPVQKTKKGKNDRKLPKTGWDASQNRDKLLRDNCLRWAGPFRSASRAMYGAAEEKKS